jgi:hypothetical protein
LVILVLNYTIWQPCSPPRCRAKSVLGRCHSCCRFVGWLTWDQCYNFKNIFDKKLAGKTAKIAENNVHNGDPWLADFRSTIDENLFGFDTFSKIELEPILRSGVTAPVPCVKTYIQQK